MTKPQRIIRIYGVPMDLGQARRGVDMGPSAIRYAGLQTRLERLGYQVHDGGNIAVPLAEQLEEIAFHDDPVIGHAHYLPQVAQACQQVFVTMDACTGENEHVIFLGGDHSISIGTVASVARCQEVGVLWIDAHGDINTPHTTPSGNIHGMSVAVLLGYGPTQLTDIGGAGAKLDPEQVAMIGVRDLDPGERERIAECGVTVHTMREVDEHGIARIAQQALRQFEPVSRIHISLDLDSLDPTVAPGVGTPVPGGLSYREAHLLMEVLADSGKVCSLDIVEVNPILDTRNQTAEVAVELAAGLFGQRIL